MWTIWLKVMQPFFEFYCWFLFQWGSFNHLIIIAVRIFRSMSCHMQINNAKNYNQIKFFCQLKCGKYFPTISFSFHADATCRFFLLKRAKILSISWTITTFVFILSVSTFQIKDFCSFPKSFYKIFMLLNNLLLFFKFLTDN